MAFQVSPGVNVSEIDATTVIPAVATSDAVIACAFQWGPADVVTVISTENELAKVFGKPDNDTASNWLSASSFLAYAGGLQAIRTIDTGTHVNAVGPAGTAVLVKNREHFDALTLTTAFTAKYPGSYGNNIGIGILHAGSGTLETLGATNPDTTTWSVDSSAIFDVLPSTSQYVLDRNGATVINDEIHIVVVDATGIISGVRGTVLEKYAHVSLCSDARDELGNINYFKEVINTNSAYIWATGQWDNYLTDAEQLADWEGSAASPADNILSTRTGAFTSIAAAINGATLQGGAGNDATANGVGARFGDSVGYKKFEDAENTNASLIISAEADGTLIGNLVDLADSRKDSLVFYSPERADVISATATSSEKTTAVLAFRNTGVNKTSSYAVMDSGWKRMYDKYNDVYRDVPLNGDIAGLVAQTEATNDAWWSPAGYTRGNIKNIVKLYLNPSQDNRDALYKAGVNPVVSFPGQGTILFGDKTTLAKPSAFDRINVRRLFIVLEKAIARAAKYSLFEFNDAFTRSQFRGMVEPFLRDVKARRGIFDYQVVCDSTNNTDSVIDRNEFVGDIYIKPARSINFIQLNFIAVRTGVSFSEVAGAV